MGRGQRHSEECSDVVGTYDEAIPPNEKSTGDNRDAWT